MSQVFKIRVFDRRDYPEVIKLISDIIVSEFKFKLEFDSLDSDLLRIEEFYSKPSGGCFWVGERSSVDNNNNNNHYRIVGTIAIRHLKQLESTCELKRMYVLKEFRRLGIGQSMIDIAIDFAKNIGYSRIVLDSSKKLEAARMLYLKAGFVDIPRYNDNYRADVFMEKKLK